MFENLKPVAIDPILGLMVAFKADNRAEKIDLGVGVYQDDRGRTPVMASVKEAESRLMELETTKTYQGMAGDPDYNQRMMELLLGKDHSILSTGRVKSIQAPGGSGALRVGAEVIRRARPESKLWVGIPTWPNHIPLLGSAGFDIKQYPYYDMDARQVDTEKMMETLRQVPVGDLVLLHGCCHNPTGADLTNEQWDFIADLALERGFIPFIDTAYQGLGNGLDQDAYGMRMMAERLPEVIIASSCSKNFGLYRERTGSITFIAETSEQADIVVSQAMSTARSIYSMPPAHGALLVSMVLGDPQLRSQWEAELEEVRLRIKSMRNLLCDSLENNAAGMDFSHIKRQNGMFSFLGITTPQLERLRTEFGIYIVSSTRINLAGVNSNNIEHLTQSLLTVLE
ncbi:MAG: aspartate/tyrosine/aromatic aminotransferase [SAR92 clade bacterium]|jgi:aspartate aminotransferase|uniref:Aspartate/tyrosine/aromatic aminotransferase n=1 Tax=SAR92 clade bacterium TaxID=2315479 RepID=A0A520MFJ5_9GAMM|nr:aspartate/tyrosine/aromatic aminotransferase [Porticoccaceae bacterium]MDA8598402.1 aspartate/tyrosine/aromatic aminotransferase [Porticoccaceae bacterium]MDA8941401.1 aspartate/tyrosine/aromatic aminotransferase [Porticoccaceae bacterium]RZO19941.1 MAG: aspartate/tyrosine/aromatic aminotransferase [SAR92 clade bacterium]